MPTSIRMPEEVEEKLSRLAKLTGRSKAFYLRLLVENGIDSLVELYEADAISKRIHEGNEKCFSLDELEETIQQKIKTKRVVKRSL